MIGPQKRSDKCSKGAKRSIYFCIVSGIKKTNALWHKGMWCYVLVITRIVAMAYTVYLKMEQKQDKQRSQTEKSEIEWNKTSNKSVQTFPTTIDRCELWLEGDDWERIRG